MSTQIILQLSGSFGVGLFTGFIGAIAGGGGLVSVPFLLFIGIPPQIALATSKFGGLGMCFGAAFKFIKEKRVIWKYAIILSVGGIIASIIGSRFLINSGNYPLDKIVGVLLLVLVPTIFLKKGFGIKKIKVTPTKKAIGTIIYFLLSILASFFGGMGVLMISSVVYFFGLSIIEANATDIIAYMVLSVTAVVIYMMNSIVNYPVGIALFCGMLLGGYAGAHTAIKKGNQFVKIIFAVVIIGSAIKILIG